MTGRIEEIIAQDLIRLYIYDIDEPSVRLLNIEHKTNSAILEPYLDVGRFITGIQLRPDGSGGSEVDPHSNFKVLHVDNDRLPGRLYTIIDDEKILNYAEAMMDFSETINGHRMTIDGYIELLKLEIDQNLLLTAEQRQMLNDKQIIKVMEEEILIKPDYRFEVEFRYRMSFPFLNDKNYLKKLKEYPDEE